MESESPALRFARLLRKCADAEAAGDGEALARASQALEPHLEAMKAVMPDTKAGLTVIEGGKD